MDTMIPWIVMLVSGAIGAVFFGVSFAKSGRFIANGIALGAIGGALGSLIFMIPLEFCTFAPDRQAIDVVFGIGLIAIGWAIVLLPLRWVIVRLRRGQAAFAISSSAGAFKGRLLPYFFLAPTITVLALFIYYPSLDTLRLSTLLARLGAPRTRFICVDNFTRLLGDSSYLDAFTRTFVISLSIVIIGLVLSLLIATMAYQPMKGARFYRALLVWPYAISPAVAGVIFLLLFNPTGGIVNYFLSTTFGVRVQWLNDPSYAPIAVIIASIWKSMGYNILFYIAGLQNVPDDLIEAAAIDGANVFQRFVRIVVPLLSPITFFLVITNMTYAFFETFGTIDYLTPGGGPLQSTTTMMYRVYQVGIQNNDLGKAAAESILLFVLVIGLTLLQFRTSGRQVNYGA